MSNKSNHSDQSADQSADKHTDSSTDQPETLEHGVATADDGQVADLQKQLDELTDALQRERADAINLRRRHQEDMTALKSRVKAGVVADLLPVIDNFERSLKHVPDELQENDYVKGVQGVVKQFEKTLAGMGVHRIKTVGQPFNPHFHEAVSMEDGEGSEEIVSEELQSGYHIGDDVIRHAMVRVRAQ